MEIAGFDDPMYSDPERARAHLEALRWPDGPVCPHCGADDERRLGLLRGRSVRPGLRKCYECRKTFSVTVGTSLENARIPLESWIRAAALMATRKGGVSARRLHQELGVTYKTAWNMVRRMREASGERPSARRRQAVRGGSPEPES